MTEILTALSFSTNVPGRIENEISRDNVIQLLLQKFTQGNIDIAFVTGDEEVGKTTLLTQFARKYANNTISSFLKPINKFSKSLDTLFFSLINQISWIMTKSELPNDFDYNFDSFRIYLNKLNKHSQGRHTYFFIIDGFENLDESDSFLFHQFFDQLPFGYINFKFLISDRSDILKNGLLKDFLKKGKLQTWENPTLTFSLTEITQFCLGLQLSPEQASEIQKITLGVPGRIKVIYDKLKGVDSFDSFFDNVNNFTDFLNREWQAINLNDNSRLVLAFVAFEDREYKSSTICKIIGLSQEEIDSYLSAFTFLQTDEKGFITFKSNHFKKYVKTKLRGKLELKVEELIIEYHIQNQSNIDSILELPKRFEKNARFDDLIKVLHEEHFLFIIEKKESFSFLEDHTQLGIKAAKELKKYSELFRLCLQKATIAELKQTFIWESEIEAKIELKDFESARNLADVSLVKEDKFRLLVFLGKKKKEKGLSIENDLLESIKTLYQQINPSSFYNGSEVVDIATNLLYTFPELAIDFLERATGHQHSNKTDLGFANLAMLMRMLSTASGDSDKISNLSSRIKNPQIRNLTEAFTTAYNATEPVSFLKQLNSDTSADKIQIARIYISENPHIKDIELVIDFVVDLLISDSMEHPITASILEDLSKPLPLHDYNTTKDIIAKLETFRALSKERGPTISNYKYLTNLAFTRIKYDFEQCKLDLLETYYEIIELQDLSLECECLAYVYAGVIKHDFSNALETSEGFKTGLEKNIESTFRAILKETGNQVVATISIIKNVSRGNPTLAIEMCKQLNTADRRYAALLESLREYLNNQTDLLQNKYLQAYYQTILDPKLKNQACLEILDRFNQTKEDIIKKFPAVLTFIAKIPNFYSNNDKSYAYTLAFQIIGKSAEKSELLQNISNEVIDFVELLDDKYSKIEFGFKLAATLIKIDKGLSKIFHDKAEKEKSRLRFDSPIILSLYFNTIRLGIFCLNGLLHDDIDTSIHIDKVIAYIKYLPSQISQSKLLAQILEALYENKKYHLFEKYFKLEITPVINYLMTGECTLSKGEKFELIENLSTVTYLHNESLCKILIQTVNALYQDECYDNICSFLLKKKSNAEGQELHLKTDFETAIKIISILENVRNDILINDIINSLQICAKNNSFTRENLIIISDKLRKIISGKLPDQDSIRHDGYKILCNAYLLRMQKNNNEKEWGTILTEARQIPNLSDKGYVLAIISNLMPENVKGITKTGILSEAFKNFDQIKVYTERVNRYSDIKHTMNELNKSECKLRLSNAIRDSVLENSYSLISAQKSIIDFAYDVDPAYAEDLLKIIDDDPARKPISEKLKKHLDGLRIETQFANDSTDSEITEIRTLSRICVDYGGKINSRRVATKHLEQAASWLDHSYKRPISESFGIFLLFIENANARFKETSHQVKTHLIPFFEASLQNIQMVKVLASKGKSKGTVSDQPSVVILPNQLIVRPGERQLALEFVKRWIIDEVVEYVKICDPYFSSKDLELVKEIYLIKQDIKFIILAQSENLEEEVNANLYRNMWKQISDDEPPEIKVIIVGYRTPKRDQIISPNHDRWYITYQSGLRVGTSFNSLGINKNSEISILTGDESTNIESQLIDKYINKSERFSNGNKLSYLEFDI